MKKILFLILLLPTLSWGANHTWNIQASGGDGTSLAYLFDHADTTISSGDTLFVDIHLSGVDSLTTTKSLDGWTNNGVVYIRTVDSVRHRGVPTNDHYFLVKGFTTTLNIGQMGVVIFEGIQLRQGLLGSYVLLDESVGRSQVTFKECLFDGDYRVLNNFGNGYTSHWKFYNCLFTNYSSGVFITNGGCTLSVYGCTFGEVGQSIVAITSTDAVFYVKNTISINNTNANGCFYSVAGGGTWDISYTVTDDATGDDWGGTGNKVNRDVIVRDSVNSVWLLAVGDTACQGAGDDLTATLPTDAQGEARSTNMDIGFDEVYYSSLVIDTADMFTATVMSGGFSGSNRNLNLGGNNQIRIGWLDGFPDDTFYQFITFEDLYEDIGGVTRYDLDSIDILFNVTLEQHSGGAPVYYVFKEVDTTLYVVEGNEIGATGDSCELTFNNYHTSGDGCANDAWSTVGGDVYSNRIDSFAVDDTTGLYNYGYGYGSGLVTYYQDIVGGYTTADTVYNTTYTAMVSLLRLEESTNTISNRVVIDAENGTTPPAITFYYYGGSDNTPGTSEGRNRSVIIGAF